MIRRHSTSRQRYEVLFDEYIAARDLITEGSLCEVRFADLEADMVAEVKRIYHTLGSVFGFFSSFLWPLRW